MDDTILNQAMHIIDGKRLAVISPQIQRALQAAEVKELFLAGGAVRDILLERETADLDFVVPARALNLARKVAALLNTTLVVLDEPHDTGRVVWQGYTLDFCGFRGGARSIEEDLPLRDFTINAMAVRLDLGNQWQGNPQPLIDPLGGREDLALRRVRATGRESFRADPLRLLRAHRFCATLGFELEATTASWMAGDAELLGKVACERIGYELHQILSSPGAAGVARRMAADRTLDAVLPELTAGRGVRQPASHHLDVLGHCLEALEKMEEIFRDWERYFGKDQAMGVYLSHQGRRAALRWAALLHDLGKPVTRSFKGERITFYNHDQVGRRVADELLRRFALGHGLRQQVAELVGYHMWPFHLANVRRRKGTITPRACLKLAKHAGPLLPGLFALAMADSLAGKGEEKPEVMEDELATLYREVMQIHRQVIQPVIEANPLLSGHDLMETFGLSPGPLIGKLLRDLEAARVEGLVKSREEAFSWLAKRLEENR